MQPIEMKKMPISYGKKKIVENPSIALRYSQWDSGSPKICSTNPKMFYTNESFFVVWKSLCVPAMCLTFTNCCLICLQMQDVATSFNSAHYYRQFIPHGEGIFSRLCFNFFFFIFFFLIFLPLPFLINWIDSSF